MSHGRNMLVVRIIAAALIVIWAIGPAQACAAAREPLYVALVWHNHQPFYKNTATGTYMMPWVRLHAAKDYYDMAAMLKDYPNVHVAFNLVPSLLQQLDEYAAGAKDIQQMLTEKPASELTTDDKNFILRRFFDANWDNIIKRHPRYWELLQKRGASVSDESIAQAIEAYTEQDFLDLQTWFNLAWLDPDFVDSDLRMGYLVDKARGFTEADKLMVLAKHIEIVKDTVPLYREMQRTGQIEVTAAPFYHPIMPLLLDNCLARISSPKLDLPQSSFRHPEDVEAHLAKAVASYREHFGTEPRGLWPSEQAVGQELIDLVHDAGFSWMASSEGVLARSLGVALRDGAGNVVRPELLYRPYVVEQNGKQVTILFRDAVLSDKIGFSYSGMPGRSAARDLLDYLRSVRQSLADCPGPHLVTIALDGENCWEYYANDGKEFLHAMYSALNSDPDLKAVTVEEYLAEHPATLRIPVLHTGSWIADNLETWIGEAEENRAWDYLYEAREALDTAIAPLCEPPEGQVGRAFDELLAAEGSDWFWWYGADQSSGNDEAFDELFRVHLRNVYSCLGLPVPGYLYIPIIPKKPAPAEERLSGLMEDPSMDGRIDWGEWDKSALYAKETAALLRGDRGEQLLRSLRVGVDAENLYVRVMTDENIACLYGSDAQIALYVSIPRRSEANPLPKFAGAGDAPDGTVLGFPLGAEIMVDFKQVVENGPVTARLALALGDGAWEDVCELQTAGVGEALEVSVPFAALGISSADTAVLAVVATRGGRNVDVIPASGPADFMAPIVGSGVSLFRISDPEGDDHGPGTYAYPMNAVFTPGAFDLTSFECIDGGDELTLNVGLAGKIVNPWKSGIGLSVQTIDIYIDTDHTIGSGLTEALGGRRVSFAAESAWDYAIWIEGWHQRVFSADGSEVGGITASVDPINNVVSITVPKSIVGTPEPGWGFQVFVLGQEGYPSQGNLRVREVMEQAAEWRFGGGDNGVFDPNVIDMLVPVGHSQEQTLSNYDAGARRQAEVQMVYPWTTRP
ncbi:MAG: glucodextranase DOMON-like domain-containing protein [Clostridia bacterium]|nr:glucodextranase DOMON-like domain-containing protein [Clostridia bacterium]